MKKMLRITQTRSAIGQKSAHRLVLSGLGLRRLHKPVVKENTPAIRGMVKKVIHLLHIEECDS